MRALAEPRPALFQRISLPFEAGVASAYLAMDRRAEAVAAIDKASSLVVDSENRSVGLELAVRAAEIVEADGRGAQARRMLREAVAEAEKLGFVGLRLEASRLLGELELRSGDPAVGSELLDEVVREASEHGFDLIARKAIAAAKKTSSILGSRSVRSACI